MGSEVGESGSLLTMGGGESDSPSLCPFFCLSGILSGILPRPPHVPSQGMGGASRADFLHSRSHTGSAVTLRFVMMEGGRGKRGGQESPGVITISDGTQRVGVLQRHILPRGLEAVTVDSRPEISGQMGLPALNTIPLFLSIGRFRCPLTLGPPPSP